METRRVVITGMGALTPVGNNVPAFWEGLLAGKNATAFPSFQKDLTEGGAVLSSAYVVRDGQFLTARGMGVSTQFGLALTAALVSPEKAAAIQDGIQWQS